MPETTNPMADLVVADDEVSGGGIYLGKYGAAKGPGSQEVSITTGDGNIDDSVQIKGADGSAIASIPYRELFSFCVITGEGKRKPAISFEHKPTEKAKSGKNHVRTLRVLMPHHPTASHANSHLCELRAESLDGCAGCCAMCRRIDGHAKGA